MSKPDNNENFSELAKNESEGIDFRIVVKPSESSAAAIIAPHGGKIEFLTAELARAIANEKLGFYAFEGMKTKSNWELHITSPNFDEPKCLALIENCDRVVAMARGQIVLDKRVSETSIDEVQSVL